MENVLVTGGAGFIGSNFIRYLLAVDSNVRVINLDSLTYAGSLANLDGIPSKERHVFVEGDICNKDLLGELFDKYRIDTIVHFAAESHVDRSIHNPGQFIQTNIIGTFNLLETARKVWPSDHPKLMDQFRFHHVSTDEVFGSLKPDDPAFNEKTPYQPNSPYSASKASSDHLVRAYHHTYGLPVTISNCTNNYGPYQYPEKLIPLMILNALEGRPLPVYGDGLQVRDWLYVEDHCDAIYLILKKGLNGETYTVGGCNQPTNMEIIKTICKVMDCLRPESPYIPHQSLIQFVPDRPGHDRRYAMDITKIAKEFGWQPRQSLESGLEKTVRWYLQNQEWILSIRQRGDYHTWMHRNYSQRGEND